MAYLARPPWPVLDRTHPLAAGLLAAFVATKGHGKGLLEFVGGNHATWSTPTVYSPAPIAGATGAALQCSGTVSRYLAVPTIPLPTAAATVVFVGRSANSTGSVFGATTDDPQIMQCHYPFGGTIYWDYGNTGAGRVSWTPGAGYWNEPHVAAFTAKSGGSAIWTDGARRASTGTFAGRSLAADTMQIGSWKNSFAWGGVVEALLIYGRVLPDREIASLADDPFRAFRPRSRLILMATSPASPFRPYFRRRSQVLGSGVH